MLNKKNTVPILIASFIISISQVFAVLHNIDDDPKIRQQEELLEKQKKEIKKPILSPSAQEFMDRISSVKTLSANFVQTEEKGNRIEGKLKLARPNKFVWNITMPQKEKQSYTTNGLKFWHYDVGLEQVVVDQFDTRKIANSPFYILLDTPDNVAKKYNITNQNASTYKLSMNKLTEQSEQNDSNYISDLTIYFDSRVKSKVINKITFVAGQSKKITVELTNVIINQGINNNTFNFIVPKGVDVINASEIS